MAFHQQINCCLNLHLEGKVNLPPCVCVPVCVSAWINAFQCHHVARISRGGFIWYFNWKKLSALYPNHSDLTPWNETRGSCLLWWNRNKSGSYCNRLQHLNGNAGAAAGTKKQWWNATSQTDFIITPAWSHWGASRAFFVFFFLACLCVVKMN